MLWAVARAGLSNHVGRLMGRAGRPKRSPHIIGHDPARPYLISSISGPTRPGLDRTGPHRTGPNHRPMTSRGDMIIWSRNFRIFPACFSKYVQNNFPHTVCLRIWLQISKFPNTLEILAKMLSNKEKTYGTPLLETDINFKASVVYP